jgi:Skp family chaperone for outer membrane proteins
MSSNGSGSRSRPGSEPALRRAGWVLALALAAGMSAAWAQPVAPGAFLVINQEQLLTLSQAGQRLLAEENQRRDTMRSEARALDSSFEEEERRLTEQRPTLSPEEFRELSDAFDARVVKARRDQDERASALAQEFDQRRRQFYAEVAPILVMLMDRYGAKAILDENSVLLADQSLNITRAVIAEIDARDAAGAPAAPEAAEPQQPPGGTTPPAPEVLAPDAAPELPTEAMPPPVRPRDEGGN